MEAAPEASEHALSSFLRTYRDRILSDWRERVRALPPAQLLGEEELTDRLPHLLDQIATTVEDLESGHTPTGTGLISEAHALERLDEGYDLVHVVHEFAELRHCALSLWATHPHSGTGDVILNQAIDQAIGVAVERFTAARERTLVALDRIGAAALSATSLDALLTALTAVLLETTASVDAVGIYLLRESDGRLVQHAAVGLEKHLPEQQTVEVGDASCVGRIAASGEPLELREAAHHTLAKEVLQCAGARAFYGVPLRRDGVIAGVAHISSRTAFEFSDEDKLLFRSMVERAAAGIRQWQLNAALRESEARFRALAENIPQLTWMADEVGTLFWYNKRFLDYTGLTFKELENSGWRQFHHPDHLDRVVDKFFRSVKDGVPWEDTFPLRGKDGQFRWFLSRATPIREEATGKVMRWIGTNTDVTEQKTLEDQRTEALKREQAAREQTERAFAMLDAVFTGAPIGLAFFDRDLRYIRINEMLARSNGLTVEAHIGKRVSEVLPEIGTGLEGVLRHILESGEGVAGAEYTQPTPGRPGETRDWQVHVYPVRLHDGSIAALAGAAVDITALKAALRTRDEILSFAAHDLRSPLASMKLLVENIRRKVLKGIETADYAWVTRKLDKLNGQVDRIASLLNELMDVSRIQAGNINLQLENVDIAELVRDISYRHGELLASNGCELRLDARGPVTGRWDALRLEQVVSNLLSNAAKYGGGHPVEIRLLTEDDLAILTVRDHGVGIASNHLDKIFERFERVGDKSAFAGTGLGLWIVKRFVTAMGGTIAVESTPGEGATFTVKLPRGTH